MKKPKVQELPSGKFRKQFRHPTTGRQQSVTGASEAEVIASIEAIKAVTRRHGYGIATEAELAATISFEKRGALTVELAWSEYEKTIRAGWLRVAKSIWKNRLAPYFGPRGELVKLVAEVTDTILAQWVTAELAKKKSPATIQNAWFCLAKAVKLQLGEKKIAELPWRDFRPPRDPELQEEKREAARSYEDIATLMHVAERIDRENLAAHRFTDLSARVATLFFLGLRQGEGAGLGWDDLALDVEEPHRPFVIIRHQAVDGWRRLHPDWDRPISSPKGKKNCRLEIHPTLVEILKSQRENLLNWGRYAADGPVFPGKSGWRTHADLVKPEQFKTMAREAGLPNVDKWAPHSLRHSFGTLEAAVAGGDMKKVQALMRHADMSTTMGYFHRLDRFAVRSGMPELPSLSRSAAPLALSEPGVPTARLLAARAAPPLLGPAPGVPGNLLGESAEVFPTDVTQITSDVAREIAHSERLATPAERKKAQQRRAKERRRGRGILSFEDAWEEWIAKLGSVEAARAALAAGKRPPAVTAAADGAYVRGYNRARAAKPGDVKAARAAGIRCKRGYVASWGKVAKKLVEETTK